MIVVFDTCTRPEYRRDVHRVLALPKNAVIRYEYKRHLLSKEAAEILEAFCSGQPTLPTILMYGQLRSYQRGDSDEGLPMLTWQSGVFVPTRSAGIVNVRVVRAAKSESDVFHFHLQLKGFVDPTIPEIERLVTVLERRNSLPFGDRETQHVWVSTLPGNLPLPIATSALISESDLLWSEVINVMFSGATQFNGDIFWRITGVKEVRGGKLIDVPLTERRGNRVHNIEWFKDYVVYQRRRYLVEYQTYDPSAHGSVIPGNATLALLPDDSDALVMVSAMPVALRPNQIGMAKFSISHSGNFGSRFAGLEIETQIPDWSEPRFDPGSRCHLTLRITRARLGIALAGILVLVGAAAAAVAATKPEGHLLRSVVSGILALLSFGGAYYSWTGKIKE